MSLNCVGSPHHLVHFLSDRYPRNDWTLSREATMLNKVVYVNPTIQPSNLMTQPRHSEVLSCASILLDSCGIDCSGVWVDGRTKKQLWWHHLCLIRSPVAQECVRRRGSLRLHSLTTPWERSHPPELADSLSDLFPASAVEPFTAQGWENIDQPVRYDFDTGLIEGEWCTPDIQTI